MPKPTYHHGKLEEAIVDLASTMLENGGAAAISLREIARELGVSHQAPYRHFKAKADVMAAIRTAGFKRLAESTHQAKLKHPRSRRRQLEQATSRYVTFAIAEPQLYQLMFGGPIESETRQQCQSDAAGEAFAALASIVSAIDQKPMPESVIEQTRVVWATMHGIASLANNGLLPQDSPTLKKLVKRSITNLE